MKFVGRRQKAVNHLVMKSYCCLDHSCSAPLNQRAEKLLLQVATEDLTED